MGSINTSVQFLVLATLSCLYCAYDNIALGKNATHEPVYNDDPQLGPEKAVDGNANNHITGGSCAITEPFTNYQKTAVWRVDLGEIKSIYSVRIHYRDDYGVDYRTRFAGFSLYISNTIYKEDGHLCYHNTEPLPPLVFSQNCTVHGQFVIIYNERKPGTTYPANYSDLAILELCEVEVFGCYRNYGPTCNQLCPQTCKTSACDVTDGRCVLCEDGITGYNCTQDCPIGTYGANCSGVCSKYCAKSGRCHHVTGYCPDGCKEGWKGNRCNIECDSGKYGRECENTCGHCRGGHPCDKSTGRCLECEPGYVFPHCHDKCATSYYGKNCSRSCSSHCKGGRLCHHVTGRCDQGCLSGFYGNTCESTDPVQNDNTNKTEPRQHEEEKPCPCTVPLVSAVVEGVVIGLGGVAISVYFLRRGRQQITKTNNESERDNYTEIDDMNRRSHEYENK